MAKLIAQPSSKRTFAGLNNNQLKIIAMLSMLVDHIGVELFPALGFLRIFGRLALPLFAYMIAEGCFYTKNRTLYLLQISALAIACQAVFFIVTQSLYQSILITFSLSIIAVYSIDALIKHKNTLSVLLSVIGLGFALFVSFVAPILLKDEGFDIDYGYLGMLLPVAIYFAKGKYAKLFACTVMLIFLFLQIGEVQIFALFALPLLALYNGQRGTPKLKYVFYIFYPAHLVFIYLIGILMIY